MPVVMLCKSKSTKLGCRNIHLQRRFNKEFTVAIFTAFRRSLLMYRHLISLIKIVGVTEREAVGIWLRRSPHYFYLETEEKKDSKINDNSFTIFLITSSGDSTRNREYCCSLGLSGGSLWIVVWYLWYTVWDCLNEAWNSGLLGNDRMSLICKAHKI